MKTLLLLRHAKSDWAHAGLRDFDRPLNERGMRAAQAMGEYMREQALGQPGLVLSSPAERARASAAIVVKAAQIDAELRYDERIYEATIEQLAEVVAQLDDAVDEVLLVGHNPGMAELIEYLTGEAREMPTAALARLRLDVESWSEVHELCGQLESLVKPKDIE